jgi:hypothetical protein
VAVAGRYVFVAGGIAGLRVVDVADPARPREVARCFVTPPADPTPTPGLAPTFVARYRTLLPLVRDDPDPPC